MPPVAASERTLTIEVLGGTRTSENTPIRTAPRLQMRSAALAMRKFPTGAVALKKKRVARRTLDSALTRPARVIEVRGARTDSTDPTGAESVGGTEKTTGAASNALSLSDMLLQLRTVSLFVLKVRRRATVRPIRLRYPMLSFCTVYQS